jgi:hypothetical protein
MSTTPLPARADPVPWTNRLGTIGFAGGYAVATVLTVTATLFAVSGAGPLRPASPLMLGLLGASLLISAGLAALLVLRIARIARERFTPDTGARLHLRFVSLFSAAAVAPAVVVALFLGTTMSRGIEEWFSSRVKTVVENAALVGRNYVEAGAAIRPDFSDRNVQRLPRRADQAALLCGRVCHRCAGASAGGDAYARSAAVSGAGLRGHHCRRNG